MASLGLWLTLFAGFCAALPAAPAAFQPILDKHSLSVEALAQRGFLLSEDGRCLRLQDGLPVEPALSPEELDALLSPAVRAQAAGTLALSMAHILTLPLPEAVVAPKPADAPPLTEPEFGEGLKPVARDLWDKKRGKQGLKALKGMFAKDDASDTGLSEDAPEALRLLTLALYDGKGGPEAPGELRRELALIAGLKPEQKTVFASRLNSPVTVYIAFSRSRTPHVFESRLYFSRMEELLAASGRTMTDFITEKDTQGKDAADFLLRAHAYDVLIPYLTRNPGEAAAIVPLLFPEGRPKDVAARASALEGLFTQLAAQGRKSGALEQFVAALKARAASASDPIARRCALYLLVNQKLLPSKLRAGVPELASMLPWKAVEGLGLLPAEPYSLWPQDEWKFALHFASTDSYKAWLGFFQSRGYRLGPNDNGVALWKMAGGLKVTLVARLHPGDEEGFLRGKVARQFLSDVARDLADPSYQGVILRNHAQFRIANLLLGKVTKGKLVLDGSCRSAWDVQTMNRRCPTCYLVVNTGTGYGSVNNEAVSAVVEGLIAQDDWEEIGEVWARALPKAAPRVQGPWTPPFAKALKTLEAEEAKP